LLDEVILDISPDGTYQLVESLLLYHVRGEGRRVLSMKVHVSVIKRGELRTIGADASYLSRDLRVGGSGIEGIGSPI
jgi:hypothetical protein